MLGLELVMSGYNNFKVSGNDFRDLYLEYIIKTIKEDNPDRKRLYDAFIRRYNKKFEKIGQFPMLSKDQIKADIMFYAIVDSVGFSDLDFYLVLSETVGDTNRIDEFGIDEYGSNFKIYAFNDLKPSSEIVPESGYLCPEEPKQIDFYSFSENGDFVNTFLSDECFKERYESKNKILKSTIIHNFSQEEWDTIDEIMRYTHQGDYLSVDQFIVNNKRADVFFDMEENKYLTLQEGLEILSDCVLNLDNDMYDRLDEIQNNIKKNQKTKRR